MTLDELVAKAGRQVDALIDRRLHDNALKMIESGLSVECIDDYLAEERENIVAWRVETLDDIRQKLQESW